MKHQLQTDMMKRVKREAMEQVKEEPTERDGVPLMDGAIVKLEPRWSMEEDQPPGVDSPAQPMADSTAGSLLSLNRSHVCHHCSAAFMLVSSLQLHMASFHGEPLPLTETAGAPASLELSGLGRKTSDKSQKNLAPGRLSAEVMDQDGKDSGDSADDFVLKLEPPWSTEEDPPGRPSAVVQPTSDTTSGSPLSLDKSRVCQLCSAAFVMFNSLKLHMASVHGEKLQAAPPTPGGNDTGNHCSTSREKTGHLGDRKKRKRDKAEEEDDKRGEGKKSRQYVCDVCSKAFGRADNLKRHKLIHTSQKPFVCDVCSKSFTQATTLKGHKRIHTGEKPYKCVHCDAHFKRSSSLQTHIRSVHAGDRPYICDVCGAAFSEVGNLKRHKRTHTDEKPYVCDFCQAAFAEASKLRMHRRIHTGEKPYVCKDCGKSFARSSVLKDHRLVHEGQKSHYCPHCPAVFVWPVSLKRHVQRVHQ